MSLLRFIYLTLTVLGALVPLRHDLAWFGSNGWSLSGLIDAWQANSATEGMVWNLGIAAAALTVWALAEIWVRRNWIALVAIPATWGVGLACGLPLYLFLRTRAVR